MHLTILWAGFLGAWLLVAGPVYQASIELTEEGLERERFNDAFSLAGRPAQVSVWWWLVPPVHLYLTRRAKERWQREAMALLSDEEYEALSAFMNKAYGWLMVGTGGLLIAAKETWELVEGSEWPTWLFWLLLVVALYLALGHAVLRTRHDAQQAEDRRTARVARGSASST